MWALQLLGGACKGRLAELQRPGAVYTLQSFSPPLSSLGSSMLCLCPPAHFPGGDSMVAMVGPHRFCLPPGPVVSSYHRILYLVKQNKKAIAVLRCSSQAGGTCVVAVGCLLPWLPSAGLLPPGQGLCVTSPLAPGVTLCPQPHNLCVGPPSPCSELGCVQQGFITFTKYILGVSFRAILNS